MNKFSQIFSLGVPLICLLMISCNDESNKSEIIENEKPTASSDGKVLNFTTVEGVNNFKNEVENIRAAYKKIGYKINIHPMPTARSLHEAKVNQYFDGELGRVKEAGNILKEHIRIKVPIIELQFYCYYLNGSINVNKWDDLKNYNFAYVRGTVAVEQNIKGKTGIALKTYEQCFELLKEGRANAVVSDITFERAPWLKKLLPKLKKGTSPLHTFKLYHFIHKKHKPLVPGLTKAISEVTGNEIEK